MHFPRLCFSLRLTRREAASGLTTLMDHTPINSRRKQPLQCMQMKDTLSRLFSLAKALPWENALWRPLFPWQQQTKGGVHPQLRLGDKLKWLFVAGGKRKCDFQYQEPPLRIQSSILKLHYSYLFPVGLEKRELEMNDSLDCSPGICLKRNSCFNFGGTCLQMLPACYGLCEILKVQTQKQ